MQCQDKFLIQSTVFPFGATEDYITSNMFAKDSGKYIEEKRLKAVIISPPSSPVLLPVNGDMKQDPSNEMIVQKDRVSSGAENIPPPLRVSSSPSNIPISNLNLSQVAWIMKTQTHSSHFMFLQKLKGLEPAQDMREDRTYEAIVPRHAENVGDMKPAKDDVQLNLTRDSEESKSRLSIMDSKLREVGQLREIYNKPNTAELKLFLELEMGQVRLSDSVVDLRAILPPEKFKEDLLLFFILFEP
ncbi:PapD-like superfamily [Sesbania bispinosa]|nr:PapD-like superfamily [Sesbania bispinosa]